MSFSVDDRCFVVETVGQVVSVFQVTNHDIVVYDVDILVVDDEDPLADFDVHYTVVDAFGSLSVAVGRQPVVYAVVVGPPFATAVDLLCRNIFE